MQAIKVTITEVISWSFILLTDTKHSNLVMFYRLY